MIVIGLFTFQVNVVLALYVPSLAVTVTPYMPSAASPRATVPLITPVDALMLKPPEPTAEYSGVPPLESSRRSSGRCCYSRC